MNSEGDSPSENQPSSDSIGSLEATEQASTEVKKSSWFKRSFNPFRIATLRGLAVVLPPLLTIVFFVWAWNAIDRAILRPVESLARNSIVWSIDDSHEDIEIQKKVRAGQGSFNEKRTVYSTPEGQQYSRILQTWLPAEVIGTVQASPGVTAPTTANDYYLRYVELRFLKRHLVIPAFLALLLALMYLVGKLLAAGAGRFFHSLINRLPIIRNVYSSVKQVTDFVFNESDIQYTRVVAVEYPRRGIWSMGFVTGDSLLDIRNASGEPMLSVLMPTSPMPATGFTISVPKSETIDLDITIDQAIQFCVSCGVVVPDHQMAKSALEGNVRRRLEAGNKTTTADKTKDDSTSEDR